MFYTARPREGSAGCGDPAPPGRLCFQCRSLLTVTPSADLHHITEHLLSLPADRVALQIEKSTTWGTPRLCRMNNEDCVRVSSPPPLKSSLTAGLLLQKLHKFCFATLVWHVGWFVIDHLLWGTLEKCAGYAIKKQTNKQTKTHFSFYTL